MCIKWKIRESYYDLSENTQIIHLYAKEESVSSRKINLMLECFTKGEEFQIYWRVNKL